MKNQKVEKRGYDELFQGVVNQIQQSRIKAATESNWIIGKMYFNIGRLLPKSKDKRTIASVKELTEKVKEILVDEKKQQE